MLLPPAVFNGYQPLLGNDQISSDKNRGEYVGKGVSATSTVLGEH